MQNDRLYREIYRTQHVQNRVGRFHFRITQSPPSPGYQFCRAVCIDGLWHSVIGLVSYGTVGGSKHRKLGAIDVAEEVKKISVLQQDKPAVDICNYGNVPTYTSAQLMNWHKLRQTKLAKSKPITKQIKRN